MIKAIANDSLSVGFFLGPGGDEKALAHSTLTLFKNHLINNAGLKSYEELFDEIIKAAQEEGVKFDKLQMVDSVHLIADVNVGKDNGDKVKVKFPGTRMPDGELRETK